MNPVVHFEMPAEDRKRMADFYGNVFEWQSEMLGPEMNEYVLVTTTEPGEDGRPRSPGAINGGFYLRSEESPVKHPSLVISVEDIRGSMEKVSAAGGTVLGEPQEIPGVGQFVYFRDTENNVVGMLEPVPMEGAG